MKYTPLLSILIVACGKPASTYQPPLTPLTSSSSGSSSGSGSSSSSSSGGSSSGAVTRADFVQQLTTMVCTAIAADCTADGYTYSQTACAAGLAAPSAGLYDPGANATFDAQAAATCLQTLPTERSGTVSIDLSCFAVFVGTTPIGATCATEDVCQSPPGSESYGWCDNTDAPPAAFCVGLVQTAPVGATCTPFSFTASPASPMYTYCDSGSAYCGNDSICHPLIPSGSGCPDGDGCANGLFCNPSGVCVAELGAGASCAGFQCADDLYCGPNSTCIPRIANGSPCATSTNPFVDPGCLFGSYCSTITEHCQPYGMVSGQSCENQPDPD